MNNLAKERIDVLLVQQELFDSREQAKRAVMAGEVYNQDNLRLDKPGEKIDADSILHLSGNQMKYVGRGAFKLEKAVNSFNIDLTDKICLDIGSSTGGFTDVALQNKAKQVYALDVGTNQLAWKLRNDERVVVMEKVNFRYSKPEDFKQGLPEFAMTDVSFISLELILPPMFDIIVPGSEAVALIKPQFEAGRENVGKKGIVKERSTHEMVINKIIDFAFETGFDILGLDYSPIKGGEGNIEFLIHIKKPDIGDQNKIMETVSVEKTLDQAYAELNK
ncbi:TlyA family RNA methyltransferase [Companilactobacillus sp. RD055328]|uniref:TlyA family RNA methyltransferase n=1 Tax=Companilactobacillus sp. RD055328 TaxID=2916634 RepID=UPI001FC824C3|nr:TlyA family RNA methyltransferase [Companilactobacillus sp. RD055328]